MFDFLKKRKRKKEFELFQKELFFIELMYSINVDNEPTPLNNINPLNDINELSVIYKLKDALGEGTALEKEFTVEDLDFLCNGLVNKAMETEGVLQAYYCDLLRTLRSKSDLLMSLILKNRSNRINFLIFYVDLLLKNNEKKFDQKKYEVEDLVFSFHYTKELIESCEEKYSAIVGKDIIFGRTMKILQDEIKKTNNKIYLDFEYFINKAESSKMNKDYFINIFKELESDDSEDCKYLRQVLKYMVLKVGNPHGHSDVQVALESFKSFTLKEFT